MNGHAILKPCTKALLAFAIAAACTSFATAKAAERNDGDIELFELPEADGAGLIGGQAQDRDDFPASFTTRQGNSACTGTFLGAHVLQLAAHCVGDGATASVKIGNQTFSGTCRHHPDFDRDETSDFALCLFRQAVNLRQFERIETNGSKVKVGTKLLLCGMGCTQPGGGGGNNDVFRCGEAPVIRLPVQDNDIVTKGSAALCFGDSGGSAFLRGPNGDLSVVGVNSRGNIRDTSFLTAPFKVLDFYRDFARANGVKICGLDRDAENCRGVVDEPDVPPGPTPDCRTELAFLLQAQERLDSAVSAMKACIEQ